MATIQKCDGCGQLSPDENGFNIASSWFTVTVDHRSKKSFHPEEFLLCEKCMGVEEPIKSFQPWVTKLTYVIREAFGLNRGKNNEQR